ncbi:hypothetical protein SteCoe_19361 [Stentor coeruleus]|uniref:Phorbol-ester/DAG-type domain-containing protein n=1 Tax=Stentor coeruleus TaxID=5963 RepID=A0A1R2BUH5_9CILI|nr:hypothetical protein SteCoe_19361 [Stentor coeruleus]
MEIINKTRIIDEKVVPVTHDFKPNLNISITKILNPFGNQNAESLEFTKRLDEISSEFSQKLPHEIAKAPVGFSINDFTIIPPDKIIFLLYKTGTVLRLQQGDHDGYPLEVLVTEDLLQKLVVEVNLNIILVGGGLFETRIFVYTLDKFENVTSLNSGNIVSSIINYPGSGILYSIHAEADVVAWDLKNMGKFSVVSNENFKFISVSQSKGWLALATKYGKIQYIADKTIEIKDIMNITKFKASYSGLYIAIGSKKSLTIYSYEEKSLNQGASHDFEAKILDLAYSPSDVLVISLINGEMHIWDHVKNRVPIIMNIKKIKKVIVGYDWNIYASTDMGILYSIQWPHFPLKYELKGTMLSGFSTDSQYLAYGTKSDINIMNLESGSCENAFSCDSDVNRLVYVRENLIFATTRTNFYLYNTFTNELTKIKNPDEDYINTIALDSIRQLLYVGGTKMTVKVFSVMPLNMIDQFSKGSNTIQSIIFNPLDSTLIIRDSSCIKIWSIESKIEVANFDYSKSLMCSLSYDSKLLFIARPDFYISVISLDSNSLYYEFSIQKCFCKSIYTCKDGSTFITGSSDGILRFWDMSTFSLIFSIKYPGAIDFMRISEDEKYISLKIDGKNIYLTIIENPLYEKHISIYSPNPNIHNFIKHFLDIRDKKQIIYDPSLENSIIMPDKITLLHIYAHFGITANVKVALYAGAPLSKYANKLTPLTLSILSNQKNTVLAFVKFFNKKITENPLLGNSISIEDLMSINKLGFSALTDFYDSLLWVNTIANLPVAISSTWRLPIHIINSEFVPQKSWFFSPETEENGLSIEFLTSLVSFNMVSGSEESIEFLKSLVTSPCQDIFRSKFIQNYIDHKWHHFILITSIQCLLYIIYMGFLCTVSITPDFNSVNIIFFSIGFTLSLYEVLQIFGGIREYFTDIWNMIDLSRTIMLIIYADSLIKSRSSQATVLLILNLFSWARGISYFRIFSRTRYMINLITEVIKDVLPFLIILGYSTIGFAFILMLMSLTNTVFSDFLSNSYLITLGTIDKPDYSTIQWICFILATIINPVIMMNLLISIMGDTHDRVQESKEVADYRELANLILEIEIATIWQRNVTSVQRMHVCREVETKNVGSTWLGKVREIKNLVNGIKMNQIKAMDVNNKMLSENNILKDQVGRIEKILISLKDKLIDSNDNTKSEIFCPQGHQIKFEYFYEKPTPCTNCKKVIEVGYYCSICSHCLCKSCFKLAYKEKVGKTDITCHRGHKLTWITDHTQYKGYEKKVFVCTGCKKKMYTNSFNCNLCKWDICYKCMDIIVSKSPIAWSKQCAQNHGLAWNPKPHSAYSCNICKVTFQKSGSFRCDICDYDVCIRCFGEIA